MNILVGGICLRFKVRKSGAAGAYVGGIYHQFFCLKFLIVRKPKGCSHDIFTHAHLKESVVELDLPKMSTLVGRVLPECAKNVVWRVLFN